MTYSEQFVGPTGPAAMFHPPDNTLAQDSVDANWPATLAKGWGSLYQAFDGSPNKWPYLQTTVTVDPGTKNLTAPNGWSDDHHTIGVDGKVLNQLLQAAKDARVPTQ